LNNERGFALILTLLITALLVALTAEFVDEVFVDTSARQNFVDGQQASLLAASGITGGIKLLQFRLGNQSYTSQADLDQFAKLMHIEDENGTIQVTAEEENGKLNINSLVFTNGDDNVPYRSIAARLFKKLGLNPELLDAVADWIGSNQVARTAGAKSPYYQAQKPPYAAKGAAMDTYEELRLVKGFDKATVDLLRPYLTVYPNVVGSLPQINVNTAAKELLASLDSAMTDALAQEIIDKRKVTPFNTATDLGNNVSGLGALAQTMASDFRIMQIEKGQIFRLTSRAQVGETIRVVEAVVQPGGTPPILYWREY
jgi:general secretion pathway protein K